MGEMTCGLILTLVRCGKRHEDGSAHRGCSVIKGAGAVTGDGPLRTPGARPGRTVPSESHSGRAADVCAHSTHTWYSLQHQDVQVKWFAIHKGHIGGFLLTFPAPILMAVPHHTLAKVHLEIRWCLTSHQFQCGNPRASVGSC